MIQSTAQLKRTPTRSIPPLDKSIHNGCSLAESRAFSFYVTKAAIDMTGKLDSGLWQNLVPQVARTDPVIWYSVLAFASLWESALVSQNRRDTRSGTENNNARQRALRWYAYALSRQRARTSESDTIEQLLTCVLFSGIEFQNRNFVDAFHMLRTAFRMLAPCLTSTRRIFNDLLGNQLTTMMFRNACVMLTSEPTVATALDGIPDAATLTEVLFHILLSVHGLIKEIYFAIAQPNSDSIEPILHRRDALWLQLDEWSIAASNLRVLQTSIGQTQSEIDYFHILHAYHEVAVSWLQSVAGLDLARSTVDEFSDTIVNTAGRIVSARNVNVPSKPAVIGTMSPYFLDLSVLPPLYFVTMMCGNPRIKDRALAMMTAHTSQREGGQVHGAIAMPRRKVSDGRILLAKVLWTVDGEQVLVDVYNNTA